MNIVTENNVPGMVPILESFELPPTIVMPFVSGVNLEDALSARPDLPWLVKLNIAINIGKIVSAGHALPQTVLHRDLKPSNIMINNFEYHGGFDPNITVLDFDMSWHKGSKERDIIFESRDDIGYLAPEQTDVTYSVSARSTRVDSYGFGMTIYFLFGREPPRSNEALSDQWLEKAIRASRRDYREKWLSPPIRLGRVVCLATQIDQSSRMDFATLVRELEAIKSSLTNESNLVNTDLWAEELIARLSENRPYHWDDAVSKGWVETASGLKIIAVGNLRHERVSFELNYSDRGLRDRANLGKYLSASTLSAEKILKSAGWHVEDLHTTSSEFRLKAYCSVRNLQSNSDITMDAAARAMRSFTLS